MTDDANTLVNLLSNLVNNNTQQADTDVADESDESDEKYYQLIFHFTNGSSVQFKVKATKFDSINDYDDPVIEVEDVNTSITSYIYTHNVLYYETIPVTSEGKRIYNS